MLQQFRHLTCWGAAALVCLWAGATAIGDEPPAQPTPATTPAPLRATTPAATPAEITRWIGELDADRFLTREKATARLVQAGTAAIEPLLAALPGSDVEATLRGVHVLQELALSADEATEAAAENALERLASARGSQMAADRALDAMNTLAVLRQERSMEVLKSLGAKFSHEVVGLGGFGVIQQFTLTIDDEFRGTESDLRLLGYLPDVNSLWLVGDKINDAALARVARMRNLGELSLKRVKASDDALALLVRLPTLVKVRLYYVPFTDTIIDHLAKVKTLEHIELFGTRVSNQGAAKLGQALAGARIDLRRGGFLGVGPQPHPEGCIIGHVIEGGAADKAGILPGDVVTHYNGKKVSDFESLTTLIGENLPGDKVPLSVVRDDERMVITVELGEWELSHRPR